MQTQHLAATTIKIEFLTDKTKLIKQIWEIRNLPSTLLSSELFLETKNYIEIKNTSSSAEQADIQNDWLKPNIPVALFQELWSRDRTCKCFHEIVFKKHFSVWQ